ncbi:hypothetical protein JCM14469_15420 [Desulfatiferula olefinivorans]
MRLIGVALLWVMIIGGLAFYMTARDDGTSPVHTEAAIPGEAASFFIDLTLTFAPAPDPFALNDPKQADPSGLVLAIDGRVLPPLTETPEPGRPVRIGPLTGEAGEVCELFVSAAPPLAPPGRHDAARIRILKNDRILCEDTFWAGSGRAITGTLQFSVTEDDHAH